MLSRTLAMLRENSLNRGFHEIDLDGARERINSTPGVRLDYLELVDPMTFGEPLRSRSECWHWLLRSLARPA